MGEGCLQPADVPAVTLQAFPRGPLEIKRPAIDDALERTRSAKGRAKEKRVYRHALRTIALAVRDSGNDGQRVMQGLTPRSCGCG